jgi:FixJ family two-component response regulator
MQAIVHVVDDDNAFRKSTVRLLRACGYDVTEYASAEHFLDEAPTQPSLGCILLDVRMPYMNGPELQARLMGMPAALPIVFLTGHGDIPTSVRTIKAGAEDFLTKPVSKDKLLDAISRALDRCRENHERDCEKHALLALVETLSPREGQVFHAVVSGKLNKQIAHDLGTTERTIKAHRHNLMSKLRARSFTELLQIADRIGSSKNNPKTK